MSNKKDFPSSLDVNDEEIPLLDEALEEVDLEQLMPDEPVDSRQEIINALKPQLEILVENVAQRAARQFEKKVYDKLLDAIMEKLPAMIEKELGKRM